jgi:hypothetical protein
VKEAHIEYLCRFDVADGDWGGNLGCDSGFRIKVALNGRGWCKGPISVSSSRIDVIADQTETLATI